MVFIILAVALFVLDICVKRRINRPYRDAGELDDREILNGNVKITRFYNKGAAMGLLKGHKVVLNIVTILVFGIIASMVPEVLKKGTFLEKLGLSFILGGAANNCYERVVKGRVTDYINFPRAFKKIKDIVFNLSDFFIFIGGIFILIASLFSKD